MRLAKIIKELNLVSSGNVDCEVTGITTAERAAKTDIAIVRNEKQMMNTKATVLLTTPIIINTDKTLVFCLQLETAAIQIATLMINKGIYVNYESPVQYHMNNQMVCMGENIVVGTDTCIKPFSCIGNNVIIGKQCKIGSNVTIASGTVIGDGVIIRDGVRIGVRPHAYYEENIIKGFPGIGKTVIGDNVEIGYNSIVQRGVFSDTAIGENTIIGDLVAIGHDVIIGAGCKIMAQVGIAGDCKIGNRVMLYGQCAINNGVKIGDKAVVYGKTGVMKNIASGEIVSGPYGRGHKAEMLLQSRIRRTFRR